MKQSEHSRTRFVQVLNSVMFSTTLSAKAKVLYAALVDHAIQTDTVWPSQDRLAEMVGCSARYIRTLMKELIAEGLVKIVKRGYWKRATEYLLTALVDMRNKGSEVHRNPASYQPYQTNNNYINRAERRFGQKKNPKEAGALAYFRRLGLQE